MRLMRFRAVSGAAMGVVLAAGVATAQPYPSRPVRMIVPGSPGGGIDFVARLAAQKLSERLGQQVVVDNRPGGAGTVGPAQAAAAAPDGYTLMLGFVGHLAMIPHAQKIAYDPLKDFAGVGLLANTYLVLVSHPSLPVRSVKQLIALARARPSEINYASGPAWTPSNLAPALFAQVAGLNMVSVQYKGTGPATVAVLGGEAHLLFTSFPAVVPHVKVGRLVALGAASPSRIRLAPDVPTLAESGVRGADTPTWYSLVAPAAIPPEPIGRLRKEVAAVVAAPDYREQLDRQGMELPAISPDEFASFLRSEFDKWGGVIRKLKAR